jgi:AcrR family transcriptional regulator
VDLSDKVRAFIKLHTSAGLFLKDPEESKVGQRMVSRGIALIYKLGFGAFTFRKLAQELDTSEASIYRYFDSKHQLLSYLINWYWGWVYWRLNAEVLPSLEKKARIRKIVKVLIASSDVDLRIPHIDESVLHKIVVAESGKLEGYYRNSAGAAAPLPTYLLCCDFISEVIRSCNPRYPHCRELAFSLISNTHQHSCYSQTAELERGKGSPSMPRLDRFIEHAALSLLF